MSDFMWMVSALVVLTEILGIVSAARAVMKTRTPQGTIVWALALMTFPFVALHPYWISGAVASTLRGDRAVIGVLVERVPGDRSAVFVPMAPAAAVGNVYIVPDELVERINAPMPDVMGAITEWGVGSRKLSREKVPSAVVGFADDASEAE